MLKHIFFTFIGLFCSIIPASSLSIELNAGKLSDLVDDHATVSELSLSGTIDASDMKFISDKMTTLESLDLGGITAIEPSEYVVVGITRNHPASAIPANVFAGSSIKSVVLPSFAGLTIGNGAFAGSMLESIDIPSTVVSVGDGAFAGCQNLKSASCATSKIGVGLFSECPKLESVTFATATDVPANTFFMCTSLKEVKGEITGAGDRSFAGCSSLKDITFGSTLSSIGNRAFMGSGLETVDLTGCPSIESVGDWAFAQMPSLTSLHLGHITETGNAIAFACPSLKDLRMAEGTRDIPAFAFSKSAMVDSTYLLPSSVETIGKYALSGLSGISTLTLPSSLEFLDDHAMERMTGLTTLNINAPGVPELGEKVWAGVDQNNVDLYVPEGLADQYSNADQWCYFRINGGNPVDKPDDPEMGIDDALGETLGGLKGRFEGDDLIVVAEGVTIDRLILYTTSGQMLLAVEPDSDTVVIDTYGFGSKVYIIAASLADGRNASLKLSKR